MSVGNLKTQGNQGNNTPYQIRTLQLLAQIDTSINAIPGVDFVTRTTTYSATVAVPGQYNISDILVRYDIIDIATSLVTTTIWFNQTQGTNLLVAPVVGTYIPITPPSTVFVGNGSAGAAVNIQDGGNSITVDDGGTSLTVDATNLDIRNITEARDRIRIADSLSHELNINPDGSVNITDNGGSLTVDSTNLDIRNLTAARDTVKISDGLHTLGINADGSVNITDNGGSLTVDAVSLPLPTGAATEATLSALNTQFTAVTRTPSITRTTGSGTITGARSISVYNAGSVAGSILGGVNNILPGEIFNFDAGGENDTLASFAYNGGGTTTLVITSIS